MYSGFRRKKHVQIAHRTCHINEAVKFLMDDMCFHMAVNQVTDAKFFGRQIASEIMREVVPRLKPDWRVMWPVEFDNEVPGADVIKETVKAVTHMVKNMAPGYAAKYDAVSNKMVFMKEENTSRYWSGNSRIRMLNHQTAGGV